MTIPDSSWPIRNAINRLDRPWFTPPQLTPRGGGKTCLRVQIQMIFNLFLHHKLAPCLARSYKCMHILHTLFNMNRCIPHLQHRWLFSLKSHAIAKAFPAPAASIVPTCQGSLMLRAISSEGQIVHMYQQEEKVRNALLSSLPRMSSSLRSQLCFVTFPAIRELNV